jgi:hypothetical protein
MTDKIEGIDETENLGDYPIDSVLIRVEHRTVFETIRKINSDKEDETKFILNPDFERDFVWDNTRQSRLIESCLMRIPLPVFYFAEEENGDTVVVDGLQRLTTFKRYLSDKFALQGLAEKSPLKNKKFQDLTPKLKSRLEATQLILYLIDSKVPEQSKLDIFERVNSGEPLTRQQMRNGLYNGLGTKWLKQQADSDWFQKATGKSLKNKNHLKSMRDREFVNRFCGFYLLGVEKYEGDMDQFLAKTLKHMNRMSMIELEKLIASFQRSMKNNYEVFGTHAFRKHQSPNDNKRSPLNIAIFEVFSVYLSRYSENDVRKKAGKIRETFYTLMKNKDFNSAVSGGTNHKQFVLSKFKLANKILEEAMR